jgi:hypothetical protein
MSEYSRKIAVGAVVAVIIGTLIVAGFYYLPQIVKYTSVTTTTIGAGTTFITNTSGGTSQMGTVITGTTNRTQTGVIGNQTTVTVTEEIIQQFIYTQRACTEQLGITNTTTYITPSITASQTNNNTVTVTEIEFTNTTTTTISSPSFITTTMNGTTVTEACG